VKTLTTCGMKLSARTRRMGNEHSAKAAAFTAE
jgi:hypothetical protein